MEQIPLEIDQVARKVVSILQQYGATRAGLFGSLVRGEARADSDIDVLVELPRNLNLLDVVGINLELEDALGRKVDLVEYETIKPIIRDRILAEEVRIL